MDNASLRRLIIDWLDDNHHFGDAEQLIGPDDASFLERGVLDSLGFVQLILHLENTIAIRINRDDLSRENFDSLTKIIAYVTGHPDYEA